MPTYVYHCSKCNSDMEANLPMSKSEAPLEERCPKCDADVGCISLKPSWKGAIGDTIRMGYRKPDSQFTDRIKEMKKDHPKGNFGRYG